MANYSSALNHYLQLNRLLFHKILCPMFYAKNAPKLNSLDTFCVNWLFWFWISVPNESHFKFSKSCFGFWLSESSILSVLRVCFSILHHHLLFLIYCFLRDIWQWMCGRHETRSNLLLIIRFIYAANAKEILMKVVLTAKWFNLIQNSKPRAPLLSVLGWSLSS